MRSSFSHVSDEAKTMPASDWLAISILIRQELSNLNSPFPLDSKSLPDRRSGYARQRGSHAPWHKVKTWQRAKREALAGLLRAIDGLKRRERYRRPYLRRDHLRCNRLLNLLPHRSDNQPNCPRRSPTTAPSPLSANPKHPPCRTMNTRASPRPQSSNRRSTVPDYDGSATASWNDTGSSPKAARTPAQHRPTTPS